MAIGVSGTNSNSTSVQVSVGPTTHVHRTGITPFNIDTFLSIIGCFDPANRKCYSGGGTSANDFIYGNTFTITGSSNSYTTYKSENVGIIEVTGDGHIKGNGGYLTNQNAGLIGSNAIELWFWPATGPTQEEAIIQLRKNDNGSYKNGYTVVRRSVGNNRSLNIYAYQNDGTFTDDVGTLSNAIWQNTWNQIILSDFRISSDQRFRLFRIYVKSPYHVYENNSLSVTFPSPAGEDDDQYNDAVLREWSIGKAEGITGTFKGKIGCAKIWSGIILNTDSLDITEPNDVNLQWVDAYKIMYNGLAPRYDQYD
jgi:hypothetical protein